MLSQRSLLLLMVLGLVSSIPHPFKWAKRQILPKVPIANPLPKPVQEIPNVPLETLKKNELTGSPEIPELNPQPIINSKDSLPLPKGDTSDYAATFGDKPILPELGVPGSPEIPGLNPLPISHEKGNLPLSNGDLLVSATTVGNKPMAPALGILGIPEIPGLNPVSITNAKTCLNLPKEDVSVKDKAELGEIPGLTKLPLINTMDSLPLPTGDLIDNVVNIEKINLSKSDVPGLNDIPALNTLPNINPKGSLPIAKGDLVVNAVTGVKPNLPNVGVPGVSESSPWNDIYHRIHRLEAVLKLEGRIQMVGGKMMATSGKEADFATSKSKCKSVGGQIATPRNEAENNAVLAFVKKYNSNTYLGMSEGPVPGIFTYLNGNRTVYTRWRKGEPRGKGKENCIEMYIDGQWNDKVCNQKRLTVCEL